MASLISHAEGSNTTGQQDMAISVPAAGGANPTGAGDLLVAILVANSSNAAWTELTTTDWTARAAQTSISCAIFSMIDDGSMPGSYTFRRSVTTAVCMGTILRFPADSTLYEEDAVSLISATGGTMTHDSITPPSGGEYYQYNARVVGGAQAWTPPGSGGGTPGNPDELYDANNGGQYALGVETIPAGATGTRAWTYTGSSSVRGANFVIVPPAVVPSGAFLSLL